MHLFREGDRLTHQLFNIVGIMLVGASAGATEGIIPLRYVKYPVKPAVLSLSEPYPIAV